MPHSVKKCSKCNSPLFGKDSKALVLYFDTNENLNEFLKVVKQELPGLKDYAIEYLNNA